MRRTPATRWRFALAAGLALAALVPPAAAQMVLLDGAFVQTPAAPGWEKVRLSADSALLQQRVEGAVTALSVRTVMVAPSTDDEVFFRQTQARQDAALAGYELGSLHFERVLRRGTPCLRYVGTFRDRGPTVPDAERHLALKGLWCRHPGAAGRQIVQVELSRRAGQADPASLATLVETADRTFDTLMFTAPSFMVRR